MNVSGSFRISKNGTLCAGEHKNLIEKELRKEKLPRKYASPQQFSLVSSDPIPGYLILPVSDFYTLDRYSPVLVSILITSPWLTNRGTYTTAPVSTVAGLVAPCAVFPANPGSVSVISSSTNNGGSIANTLPL